MNNPFSTLPLYAAGIGAACSFLLGWFVLVKNKKALLNKLFFFFSICITIWLASTVGMFKNCGNHQVAEQWDRIIYSTVSFIPVLMYHISLVFTGFKKQKIVLILGYFLAIIFAILSQSSLLIDGMFNYKYGCHTLAQPLHNVFLLIFMGYVSMFFLNTFIFYGKTKIPMKKAQARYFLLAFGVFSLGALAFFPAYKIPIPPYTFLAELGGVIIMAYAITRYRLMDIRMVLGKGAIYGFSFLSVIGVGFFLNFLNQKIPEPISYNIFLPVIIVISAGLFKIFFWLFEKLSSKYFFYTFYSYQKVLRELGEKLTRFLDLEKLSTLIVSTLIKTMKLDKTIILLRDPENGIYRIQKNIGFNENNGISLVRDNFLTKYLRENQKPLIREEISLAVRSAISNYEAKNLEKLQGNMKRIEAELCLPLLRKSKITGMIVLGKKISGDPYSKEDLELLTTLASQASIALENARLYEQISDFSENLQEKVNDQTRELKKAYEELKELDKAKSEFISMASHQLRTPLTSIKGYISMLIEGDFGKISLNVKKALKNIFQSSERLIRIVNDLLNISRVELGKMEIEKKLTKLEPLLESCVEEMKPKAEEKKLKIEFKKSKEQIPKLSIDDLKIRQVVLNLIDNAIRYTHKGKIEVSVQKKKKSVLVLVKDTGEGLSREEQKQIFSGFTRGSAGLAFFIEGAGLGLYVAEKYLELHNGKIYAKSKGKRKGSTFFVELPLN